MRAAPQVERKRKPAGPCHIDLPVLIPGNCGNRFFRHWRRNLRGLVFAGTFWLPAATIIAVCAGPRKSMPARDCLQCPGYPFPTRGRWVRRRGHTLQGFHLTPLRNVGWCGLSAVAIRKVFAAFDCSRFFRGGMGAACAAPRRAYWLRLLIFRALNVGAAWVLPATQGFTTFYHCLFFLKPVLTWALPLFTTYEKKW